MNNTFSAIDSNVLDQVTGGIDLRAAHNAGAANAPTGAAIGAGVGAAAGAAGTMGAGLVPGAIAGAGLGGAAGYLWGAGRNVFNQVTGR